MQNLNNPSIKQSLIYLLVVIVFLLGFGFFLWYTVGANAGIGLPCIPVKFLDIFCPKQLTAPTL